MRYLVALIVALLMAGCSGQAMGPAAGGSDGDEEPPPKTAPNPVCEEPSVEEVSDCPTEPAEICAAIGYECGKVFANIGCGEQPELVDCGGCSDGYQCIEGSCACPEQFECGEVQTACGGTTSCGSCADGYACGDDNTCYCEREPDEEICERLGYECGLAEAEDFCGSTVTADCGGCATGVCSARSCHDEVTLEPTDIPSDESGARFGTIMAARPGFIAVSERYLDDGSANNAGAVRVFERQDDASWQSGKRLRAPMPTGGGLFGWNLAATDDYLFVSAKSTDAGGSAVFVFAAADGWQLTQTLRSPDPQTGRNFGADMRLTPDGRLLVASRPVLDNPAPGRVDIYALASNRWEHEHHIAAPSGLPAGARFAQEATASDDFVFVAADFAEVDGKAEVGVVYVFREDAGSFEQVARLAPSDPRSPMWFGHRLAYTDGSLLVAAPHDSDEADGSGTVYVFDQDDAGDWLEHQQLHDPEPRNQGRFGHDLAATGNHTVIGLWDDESVFLFAKRGGEWVMTRDIQANDSDPDSWFGYRVTMLDDAVVVGEPRRDEHGVVRLYGLE